MELVWVETFEWLEIKLVSVKQPRNGFPTDCVSRSEKIAFVAILNYETTKTINCNQVHVALRFLISR